MPSHPKPASYARALTLLTAVAATAVTGCASPGSSIAELDPYEEGNRKVYAFNDGFDTYALKPATDAYTTVTPDFIETGVSNFFDNLTYPNVIVNDFLQAKFKRGASDTGRFLINTTVGVVGLFDVATHVGLDEHDEDFGQTLGVWGSGSGPFLTIPFLGPSSGRDAWGIPVSWVLNPLFYVESQIWIPLSILQAIDLRARLAGVFRFREAAAVDPYSFTRDGYLQHREFLIYDGDPPLPDYESLDGPEDGPGSGPGGDPAQP